jgi:hypothetical protein
MAAVALQHGVSPPGEAAVLFEGMMLEVERMFCDRELMKFCCSQCLRVSFSKSLQNCSHFQISVCY